MIRDILTKKQARIALPERISRLIQEMNYVFENSKHKLIVLAHKQEELDLIASDFGLAPFMEMKLSNDNLFEPDNTRQMYSRLKERTRFSKLYWKNELKDELSEFRSKVERLEILSKLYRQYLSESRLGYDPDLTFVLSKPDSPLMMIYSGTKAMVYNFAGHA
jgi:hypothetical protein